MKLLSADERTQIIKEEYKTEGDPILKIKFFDPAGSWTWYVVSGEPVADDYIFYGYVKGFENEWGDFSLNELESVVRNVSIQAGNETLTGSVTLERDLYFKPVAFSELPDYE